MYDQEFSDNRIPLAYLITFRCYGTWLHGDARGSTDRDHNSWKAPFYPRDAAREKREQQWLKNVPVILDEPRRIIVDQTIREICEHRHWRLWAINVRTNHIHVVVAAPCKPEKILNDFKAYTTRRLREAGLWEKAHSPWAQHGSRRYLWRPQQVERACNYVINHQGDSLIPDFGSETNNNLVKETANFSRE